MGELLNRFTAFAKGVISRSVAAARELGHSHVGSEHLLLALAESRESTVYSILYNRGVKRDGIKERIIGIVGLGVKSDLTADDMTPVFKRILLRSSFIARDTGADGVGAEHLLMALLDEECVAVRIIGDLGADAGELSETLYSIFGEVCDEGEEELPEPEEERAFTDTPLLNANATDLTERARRGELDPVIGRAQEEARIISILLRRTKNNPCLVGEAGVGKTAIVESLAARVASGKVPPGLKDARIMSLEAASVVAGTKYRGEFEEKIKGIVDEARSGGNVILFIDEIHTIVGAGGAEGAIDASNILKPALARGEIKLIGATTQREYRQSIEKDKALARRFQTVTVREPDPSRCREMLMGIKSEYESFHGVTIKASAIDAAIELSRRYMPERFLPDKAIDLIDEAAARKRSICSGDVTEVCESDVVSAVSLRTGVPAELISHGEQALLSSLSQKLKKRLTGQDEAIDKLCCAIIRSRSGADKSGLPCSLIFAGKEGVGKSECARAIADLLFRGRSSLLRLDMGEYSEPHSVSKLIGAPAGYVGHGEGGILTERVRREPYSLILFDGIEKAHPDVRAVAAQIIDEGELTDCSGETVSFSQTTVIFTCRASGSRTVGFTGCGEVCSASIPPDLAEKVDEIVWFADLTQSDLAAIALARLDELQKRCRVMGTDVAFDADAARRIIAREKPKTARAAIRAVLRAAGEILFETGEIARQTEKIPQKLLTSGR